MAYGPIRFRRERGIVLARFGNQVVGVGSRHALPPPVATGRQVVNEIPVLLGEPEEGAVNVPKEGCVLDPELADQCS